MSALLGWLFTHAELVLAANLAAGCYAAIAFLPEVMVMRELRSPLVRIALVLLAAVIGVPLLVCLFFGAVLERESAQYPPVPRGRG